MIRLCDESEAHNFTVGQPVTFTPRPRWYVRLWRWVTRYKAPTFTISHVDRERGVITLK